LLAQGFPKRKPKGVRKPRPKPKPKPKETMEKKFTKNTNQRIEAIEKGDFSTVWGHFSERRKAEMAKAGISRSGFIKVQSLTHKLESGVSQETVRSKKINNVRRVLLIRQSQKDRPEVLIMQTWVVEDGEWKLDSEAKKATPKTASNKPPTDTQKTPQKTVKNTSKTNPEVKRSTVPVMSLPGLQ